MKATDRENFDRLFQAFAGYYRATPDDTQTQAYFVGLTAYPFSIVEEACEAVLAVDGQGSEMPTVEALASVCYGITEARANANANAGDALLRKMKSCQQHVYEDQAELLADSPYSHYRVCQRCEHTLPVRKPIAMEVAA